MAKSKEFQLWLRRTLGQQAVVEAEVTRHLDVALRDVKVEVRIKGRWVTVDEHSLGS